MPFVLDASVTVNWALRDEDNSIADRAFLNLRNGSAIVPGIWWYELRNILVVNERRGRISAFDSGNFLAQLRELDIEIRHEPDNPSVLDLARSTGLTVYDASYLALAMREGVPLATLDKALQTAANTAGVPLLA
jgi:predicted nucleic acid-binding protein